MRGFWAILLVTVLVGIAGMWTLAAGASQYTNTVRTYTTLRIEYVPDSFTWLDPDFNGATVSLRFVNHSPAVAHIDPLKFNVAVLFDGVFAGRFYERIERFSVPRGESVEITVPIRITNPEVRALGGTAQLRLSGNSSVAFEGVEAPWMFGIFDRMGQVSWEPSGG